MRAKIVLTTVALLLMNSYLNAQTRDNAGLQGDAGATSGMFETYQPTNYPAGASSWWHLLDVRHSNPNNNYAMQFSGSFFDQSLYFRKTVNNASQPWSRVISETNGLTGVGTTGPVYKLHVAQDVSMNQDIDIAQFGVSGATDNAKRVVIGYDVNGAGFGYIKAGWYQHQWTNLSLQPNGGNVGIGTVNPDEKLTVKGKIHANEVRVDMSVLPDYVFHPTYNLASLKDVKAYIDKNHHLPEVPSAQQVAKDGLKLGEMNAILLKKVEELTLYLIEQQKTSQAQQKQIDELKKQLSINKTSTPR